MITSTINHLSKQFYALYKKTETVVDGTQQQFSISEAFINASIEKFVTDNVHAIKDLHLEAFDDWLRLFCSVDVLGNHFDLSVDLKLVRTSINEREQLFVFQQISNTQVIQARYANPLFKYATQSALFIFRHVLRKDPLGFVLAQLHKKWDIGINQYDGLFHLDIMRWLKNHPDILQQLKKANITHASLASGRLIAIGRLHLNEIVQLDSTWFNHQPE